MSMGASGSKSTPKAVQQYTGGQMDLLSQLTGVLTGEFGQGVSAYPGQITPGPSGLQSQAFGQISDILGGGGKYAGTAEMGAGTLEDLLKSFDPTLSMQAWEKGIKEPAARAWQGEMMPAIMEKYAGANALESSGLRKELVGGGEKLAADLGGQLAQILLQQQGQTQQTQLGAAGLGQQYAQMPLQQAMTGLQAGEMQRGITAEQMGEPYQKWQTEQPYNNPWLQLIQTVFGADPYQVAQKSKSFGGQGSCGFVITLGEGQVTETVRKVRDHIIDALEKPAITVGYKKFCKVVIPMMKQSKFIFNLFRIVLTRPISIFSKWYLEKRSEKIIFIPLGLFWLSIFNGLGGGKILNIRKTIKIMMGD